MFRHSPPHSTVAPTASATIRRPQHPGAAFARSVPLGGWGENNLRLTDIASSCSTPSSSLVSLSSGPHERSGQPLPHERTNSNYSLGLIFDMDDISPERGVGDVRAPPRPLPPPSAPSHHTPPPANDPAHTVPPGPGAGFASLLVRRGGGFGRCAYCGRVIYAIDADEHLALCPRRAVPAPGLRVALARRLQEFLTRWRRPEPTRSADLRSLGDEPA